MINLRKIIRKGVDDILSDLKVSTAPESEELILKRIGEIELEIKGNLTVADVDRMIHEFTQEV